MFDMNEMMKNLPEMMGKVKQMKDDQKAARVKGSAGGGMVVAEMNGAGELLNLKIEKEVVDPEDIEMLQDLIIAAVADAKKKTAQSSSDQLSSLTGGLDLSSLGINLPGM